MPAGADAWMEQGVVLRGLSVGAPPDQFNPAGQDWGLTAYNPHGLVASRFEPFRQMLRAAMRHAGAVRHRPRARPDAALRHSAWPAGASQGAYLRLPFADMLAVVAEESRRWNCIVIGEDLGTVPEDFRATLVGLGRVVLSRRAVRAELGRLVSPARANIPSSAIATFNTHDLPTFAGWMSSHDLKIKRAIDVDPGETEDDRHRSRVTLCAALAAATGHQQIGFEDVAAFLAATPTRLVSIAIEDVLGDRGSGQRAGHGDRASELAAALAGRCWRSLRPISGCARIAATFSRAGRGSAPSS